MSAGLTDTAPSRPPSASGSRLKAFFSAENRFLAPILITCILLVGEFTFGMLESWGKLFLAIGTSIVTELVLGRLVTRRWPHLASAYISGISVGILVRSPLAWPYILCSALSIMSKYVLRWRGRHLWNPTNFGVSAMLFLYPAAVASLSIQWGNTILPMVVVWILGSLILARLRRFHVCVAYVVSFVALSWVRSRITGSPWLAEVAPVTGPMYQLFIFFMITDPKTTVHSWRGRCLVAALVAVVEAVLRLVDVVDAPFYALFLVGPAANVVEILGSRAGRPTPAQAVQRTFAGKAGAVGDR
jgi:Na+-translocating ferredoxin:NAD+ oxidoreductase RnfD subunit